MKNIYLDHAASTPTEPQVLETMTAVVNIFGNPSSFNDAGRRARKILEKSRKKVADFLHARPDEVIFTASGSEANNLALAGYLAGKSGRVLTTPIEHPSVLECLRFLPNIKIDYLKVDSEGLIDLKDLENKLKPDVLLISIMYANNEVGTIEPIAKIGKIIKKIDNAPLFHVDACQAPGFLDMNIQNLRADLLVFNGSKIYGPRGIGVLYRRRGINLQPLSRGGGQEYGLKAGTENLPAIAGLAKAIDLINTSSESKKLSQLRDHTISKIKIEIPEALLVGPEGDCRLPNNINICLPNLTSEIILLELDKYGISAGSGSACTSHSVEPSHVLKAIGVPKNQINGALRFSLGRETTKDNMDYLVKLLIKIIANLNTRYRERGAR